jgi:modulator of FtsH protease
VRVAYSASEWSDLFVACAGASAALAGLVFVAVSINIDRILALEGLPERALATLLLLLGVVVASTLGLVPGLGSAVLGVLLLVDSLGFLAVIATLSVRGLPTGRPMGEHAARAVVVAIGTVPLVIGAVSLIASTGGGLYWTLAGILGALVGGVLNAWVLLVEILR